jgi:hypothetical protein
MKALTATVLAAILLAQTSTAAEPLPRERFEIDDHRAFVILPDAEKPKPGGVIPWVLYAPRFHNSLPSDRDEGWMMRQFLDAGIAVAGVDAGEFYGSPDRQRALGH